MVRGRWLGIALGLSALMAQLDQAHADHTVTVGDTTVEFRNADGYDEPQRIVGRAADGTERWTIEHREWTYKFVEPVLVDGRLLYTRYGDLVELDAERGQIVNRWRFPGRIKKLAREATSLLVTVRDDATWDDEEVVLRYRLDQPPPGRSYWGILVVVKNCAEGARWTPSDRADYTAEAVAAALARTRAAAASDPTNPHLRYAVGRWLLLAGDEAGARGAFAEAATNDRAPWSDFYSLAEQLQAYDAGAARAAFDTGYRKMIDAGVRPERMQTLVERNVLFLNQSSRNIRKALAAGDVELAHELMSRVWRVMPRLEMGPRAWRVLAAWMADRDRSDLADVWRQRAARAEDGWLNRIALRMYGATNVAYPLSAGLIFGFMLAVFLVGARLRRRVGLRSVAVLLATPLVPLVAAMVIAATPAAWVWAGNSMFFPDDSFDAPSVVAVLEQRPASAARDDVLEWARAESAATLAGTRFDGPMPDEAAVAEAVMPTPTWWQGFQTADRVIAGELPDIGALRFSNTDHWLEVALLVLIPLLLGLALGRFARPVARWSERLVPGAARSWSIMGGAAFGVFLGAVFVIAGTHSYGADEYLLNPVGFGLEQIWQNLAPGPSLWWYVPLVGIPLLQGLFVWREVRATKVAGASRGWRDNTVSA